MLRLVGFADPHRAYDMYSMELSGGMRQRAMIAMALICHPALLVADEPTTALDVTVQAQVLGLLRDLQQRLGMSMLLITHDLGVVANMADEVVVIYHGEIVEAGSVEHIFRHAGHPYTGRSCAPCPRSTPASRGSLSACARSTTSSPNRCGATGTGGTPRRRRWSACAG
jgi:peptide/nickel transport system ATP-binding protein